MTRQLWNRDKQKARRLLGDPRAQWAYKTLGAPEGQLRLKVTRTR